MYEHHAHPILSARAFFNRWLRHAAVALSVVLFSLGLGVTGYHTLEGLSWIDSFLNAAMLLGGMGPVNALTTDAGKLFAAFYALYSGLIFLVVAGLLFVPLIHRFLHRFHLEMDDDQADGATRDAS